MKKFDYKITINHAFEQVIRSCSLPRSYADETWISEEIIHGYCQLFQAGYAYSVEVWDQDKIVGGLVWCDDWPWCVLVSRCLALKPMFPKWLFTH